jgi:hypothetical protein
MDRSGDRRAHATSCLDPGSPGTGLPSAGAPVRPDRPALVRRLRREVEAGRYRPPVDAVAEDVLAWLAPPDGW